MRRKKGNDLSDRTVHWKKILSGFGSVSDIDPGEIAERLYGDRFNYGYAMAKLLHGITPVKEIWWGVTCENQQRADERIPHLFRLDGLKRWLSLEPLLGPIMLDNLQGGIKYDMFGNAYDAEPYYSYLDNIDWVVVGAESGKDGERRECKIEWIESIVQQCRNAGVPVFVKQIHIGCKLITDINKFPEDLRIRETPWRKIWKYQKDSN